MTRDYAVSANGRCQAVASLEREEWVRVTDEAGRVLEGPVNECVRSDFKGRVVRRFMAGGQKAGLYVSTDPEGGLVEVSVMYNGQKERVLVVETGRPEE